MAGLGWAWHGGARRGKARLGKTRQGFHLTKEPTSGHAVLPLRQPGPYHCGPEVGWISGRVNGSSGERFYSHPHSLAVVLTVAVLGNGEI